MAYQFQPPSFAKPNDYGNIPRSIDQLFEQYIQGKAQQSQQARLDAQDSRLASQDKRQQGIDFLERGFDPADAPQLAAQVAGEAPRSAMTPRGAGSPDEFAFEQESPVLAAFKDYMSKKKSGAEMKSRTEQAGLAKIESETAKNQAQAAALGRDQIYVDPDTGKQIIVPRGAKLIPRSPRGGKMATNQDLDSAMELYETAKEGLISGLGGSETGQIIGRLPAMTAKQQIAKGSVAAMAPVLKQIFRTAGEGVFTDRDQQLLLDMIPTRTELPEAREAMIANIDAIVKAKIKSGMRNTQAAPKSQAESAPINQQTDTASRARAILAARRGQR